MIVIKRAKQDNVKDLAQLWYEMAIEYWALTGNVIYKPKPKEEFMKLARKTLTKKLKDRKHFAFIALVDNEVIGFCFTPQDGNSLLSSVTAVERFLYPDSYEEKVKCLWPFLLQEV